MLEILTRSGAIIHTDPMDATQAAMINVAVTALGGSMFEREITVDEVPC